MSVYLLDVVPQPAVRSAGRPPLQLWLRYLVSTWARERGDADRLLVELAYAAMEQPDIEIDPEVTLPETWTALRAVARPSFIVRVTERRARARPVAPPVLHPIRIEPAFPSFIAGVVRGPGGIALPDATVALPSVGRESRTDARGRFLLQGVPGPPVSTHLVVRAKGTETVVKLPKDPARARALVIEIKSLEGVNA
ncbi:MAG TPA: carboxypeptidase-like regulatory domain-containing protein [Candidatus Limnocylindria bacterium]